VFLDARVSVVNELYVREWKVSDSSVDDALPLTVDGHLGDLDHVAHVEAQRGPVVGVRHAGLLHAGVRGEFALKKKGRKCTQLWGARWPKNCIFVK
jgi:hypothetical protein